MSSPRAKSFSYHQPRSVSRSSSPIQRRVASNRSASPSVKDDLRTSMNRTLEGARIGARPLRTMSETPSHQASLNAAKYPVHAETVNSKPRAQRSHSSPPKPKAVQFAEGTKGTPRHKSTSTPPLVRTPRMKPMAREEAGASDRTPTASEKQSTRRSLNMALTSPPDLAKLKSLSVSSQGAPHRASPDVKQASKSLNVSPRKTEKRRLEAQLQGNAARIAMLEEVNARYLKIIKDHEAEIEDLLGKNAYQKDQIKVLNEKNSSLFEDKIRLSEEIYELSINKTLWMEENQ